MWMICRCGGGGCGGGGSGGGGGGGVCVYVCVCVCVCVCLLFLSSRIQYYNSNLILSIADICVSRGSVSNVWMD